MKDLKRQQVSPGNYSSYDNAGTHNPKRLKVLFLPAWYPSEIHKISGIFIQEHAKAASLYNDIIVLYAYPDCAPQAGGSHRVSDDFEGGIRTIMIRYGRIFFLTLKLLTSSRDKSLSPGSSMSYTTTLMRTLAVPVMVMYDLLYYLNVFFTFHRLVKCGWKPDIIHAHVYSAALPAVLLGKMYRIPIVISEHSSAFPENILTYYDRAKARFAMNRARLILPVSDFLKRAIEAHGIKSKSYVVPNAVDTNTFCPLAEGTQGDVSTKKIAMVALLDWRKGVPFLLDAVGQLKVKRNDFSLDIVGDGPNRKEYEELACKLELEDMVRFHGLKSKQEVAEFMQQCAFCVQPSLWETFGVACIEAMACGKPVIATTGSGPAEIVNEEVGILVPPGDVKALANAVDYMLDNYQRYSIGIIANYAKQRFGYETVGRKLDALYRQVMLHGS